LHDRRFMHAIMWLSNCDWLVVTGVNDHFAFAHWYFHSRLSEHIPELFDKVTDSSFYFQYEVLVKFFSIDVRIEFIVKV
jgi:hypothetical protein